MLLYTGLYYFSRDKGEEKTTPPILSYFLYVTGCMLYTNSRIIYPLRLPFLAKMPLAEYTHRRAKTFIWLVQSFFFFSRSKLY